jgi:hypothetical protein
MPFTVTQPLGRPPTFPELQELAGQHDVQINVRVKGLRSHAAGGVAEELAGDFCYPDPEHPKVKGNYAFEPNGEIRGNFSGQVLGKLAGSFVFADGKAEVTITEKPFLLPEAILKTKISEALKEFCAKIFT